MSSQPQRTFSKKQIQTIIKIVFLESMLIIFVLPTNQSTGEIPPTFPSFGTWTSFPSATVPVDKNELFFNNSYRVVVDFPTGFAQVSVELFSSCVKKSNTVNALLDLQMATYSASTNTNSTNFSDIGGGVVNFIDGSVGNPCPGINASFPVPIPDSGATTSTYRIFRVIGENGGGLGDNPRLQSVYVELIQLQRPLVNVAAIQSGTNGLTAIDLSSQVNLFFSGTFTVTFDWLATNATITNPKITQHGENTCTGTAAAGCAIIVTYPIAFTTLPNVFATLNTESGIPNISIPIGSYTLFQTFLN